MQPIHYPFDRFDGPKQQERNSFTLAELKSSESELLAARSSDPELSNKTRAPGKGSPRWAKFRNEELVPLLYFAKHTNASDETSIRVMPERNDIDIEFTSSGVTKKLQITMAYPDWAAAGVIPESQSAGHYHRQQMELLNQDGESGFGPIVKGEGNRLSQEQTSPTTPEILCAFREGMQQALAKKLAKSYQTCSLVLIVHAAESSEWLSLEQFISVIREAFSAAKAEAVGEMHFSEIYVLDNEPGFFVKLRESLGN